MPTFSINELFVNVKFQAKWMGEGGLWSARGDEVAGQDGLGLVGTSNHLVFLDEQTKRAMSSF